MGKFYFKKKYISKLLWSVWGFCAIIFFEIIVTDVPFMSFRSPWKTYLIMLFVLLLLFSEEKYIIQYTNKRWKVALSVYAINILAIVLETYLYTQYSYVDFGYNYLIRESVIFFFWICSIPLILLNNIKFWCIYASAIYLNSILYLKFLVKVSTITEQVSNMYFLFTIGISSITLLVSISLFVYLFRGKLQKL